MRTKLRIRELVLEILREGTPMHPYGVYREIRERYHMKLSYSTIRRVLLELLGEGRVRRLSGRFVEVSEGYGRFVGIRIKSILYVPTRL